MPPYVVVYRQGISTTHGGQKSKFGFVAVLRVMNEEGIDVHIPVGYKYEIGAASMRCSPAQPYLRIIQLPFFLAPSR